jgi:cysteine-rich repeat protein
MRGAAVVAILVLAAGCGDNVTSNFVPVVNICGDGAEEGWEACDCGTDPLLLPQGCEHVNSDEPNQLCRTDCTTQRCGDGVIDDLFDEQCDDGPDNSLTSGHCRPDCTLATCGDGVIDPGEDCDNGPENSDLPDLGACRTDCKALRCGDGVRDLTREEECDDGNTDETDGCLTTCKVAFCGDGAIRAMVEQCDDGPNNSNDPGAHCRLDCRLARCGDGITDPGEECDDGVNNSDTIADRCRTDCTAHRCGDGVTDGDEQCDTGAARSNTTPDACRLDCKNPSCGDAVTDTGEGCDCGTDPGNLPAGCTKVNCVGEAGCTCSPACKSAFCGNGNLDPNEECDDGDGVNCDDPNCHCRTTCKLRACGDGITDDLSGEECDTGAARSNTIPDRCRLNCKNPWCGDNVIDTSHGEQCDDFAYWGLSCNQSNCQKQYGPTMVVNWMEIDSNLANGCDLNGDGQPDNWLAPLGALISSVLQGNITDGTLLYLLELRRLNDATGQNDPDVELARFSAVDHETHTVGQDPPPPAPFPTDNFSGSEPFYIDPVSLDGNGNPLSLFVASLATGDISGTAPVFYLPTAFGMLELRQASLAAHLVPNPPPPPTPESISGVSVIPADPGRICGAIPACTLDQMLVSNLGLPPQFQVAETLLEILIVLGIYYADPPFDYFPDIDLDGDNPTNNPAKREAFAVAPGVDGIFRLVTCKDSDNTVVLKDDASSPTGRCPCGARFNKDGYSVRVNFTSVGASISGVCASGVPPCI